MKGLIEWAADAPREFNGKMNYGIKMRGNFYNFYGTDDKIIGFLKKGNEIEFETEAGKMINIKLIKKAEIKQKSDIVKISGKDHMTYPGLLRMAHEKDPDFSMKITESFVSKDMKMSWCKVRLTTKLGRQVFDGFGSSTPENTGLMTQSHPVEMAHTRAKGRALRDFVNIGVAMAEELKHDD